MNKFLAALAIVFALPASAGTIGPYSDVYYFGDSLTDSGNAATLSAQFNLNFDYNSYPLGQFTNGNTWATQIGATPSLLGGTNYAFGGARTVDNGDIIPDLGAQIVQFVADAPTLGQTPLAAIWIGGNDFRDFAAAGAGGGDPTAIAGFVGGLITEISTAVSTLASAGIGEVVVFGLPDLGELPDFVGTQFGAAVTQIVTGYNTALQGNVLQLDAWFAGAKFSYFDVNSLFLQALGPNNPLGYTNWTQACLDNLAACQGNEDTWVFWDSIHPTESVHAAIAGAFVDQVAPVPLPAGFPLLLGGLAVFGLVSSRRKSLA
ncbi:MAG: VPLPA-CTERM sorting domain-containing protein [Silicimonas sp.]|nr:VPLPA-CTERM sorting domain-containing protein [Silicimonas sp.]